MALRSASSYFLAVVVLVVVGLPAMADVTTVAYEADALPEASTPPWSRYTPEIVTVAEILPPGVLHLRIDGYTGAGANEYWRLLSPVPIEHNRIFLEARLKVASVPRTDAILQLAHNGIETKFYINDVLIGYVGGPGPVNNVYMDTTDDYHVYRLEMDFETEEYRFLVDGEQELASTGVFPTLNGNSLRIGGFGSDWDAELHIDYIRVGTLAGKVGRSQNSWASLKHLF